MAARHLEHMQAASTAGAMASHMRVIERDYVLVDRVRIVRFLDEHAHLAPVLLEAHGRVHDHFPDTPLFLEVVTDPDLVDADDADELVLSIATDLDAGEAMERLNELDAEWWLDTLPRTRGKLCLNLEFR